MTEIEKKALYNSLRMNWLQDPSMKVEQWQVEDYRGVTLSSLFERLKKQTIDLDQKSFLTFSDDCNSPEDLTEFLIGDDEVEADVEDKIYLLVFEIWRRLIPEKPSLSIFCDELDNQIYLYDNGQLTEQEHLQTLLEQLSVTLDENVDQGIEPKEAFELISGYCANDIETFLYDYISDQIDQENVFYAQDLLEGFQIYLKGNKWFSLLRARLMSCSSIGAAHKLLGQLIEEYAEEGDLEFNLELLSLTVNIGPHGFFQDIVKISIPFMTKEEDFQDLLGICIDYYHRLDMDETENSIQEITKKRSKISLEKPLDPKDPDIANLCNVVKKSELF